MQTNIECEAICGKIDIDEKTSRRLLHHIKADYKVEWYFLFSFSFSFFFFLFSFLFLLVINPFLGTTRIIENLPGATPYKTSETGDKQYEQGFKFGTWDAEVGGILVQSRFLRPNLDPFFFRLLNRTRKPTCTTTFPLSSSTTTRLRSILVPGSSALRFIHRGFQLPCSFPPALL